ncbi:MAG: PIN domain protein [Bacteroidetes bacterium RIFCSPLOWO2_02_FULL_36_8]|nr:MAG: PIN domain protein [Bacteroidetes bacterium RIFCSPLOWO2_02_FULL_36_8]OFY69051.1 MAG: PIN domain protein [Bacteroidetes bacterium RIFCSPLOWO2_12_FULL_37_12]
MKQRIYIDTSVVGGCFDKEFKEWSDKLFDDFRSGNKIAVISDITLDELSFSRPEVCNHLDTIPNDHKEYVFNDEQAEELADKYIKEKAVTQKSHEDALHIAIATVNKVDVLVSWNFKHIVNLDRIRKYNAVNLMNGYTMLEIRNPREILK